MRFKLAGLAGAVLVMAITPATALGKVTDITLKADASNGYGFTAFESSDGGGSGMSFGKRTRTKTVSSSYFSPSGAGSASIDRSAFNATFGEYGRIKTEFHEKKVKTIEPPKGCKGPDTKLHKGVFKGKIKVEAENGYSKVNLKRAKGSIAVTKERPNCSGIVFPSDKGTVYLGTFGGGTGKKPVFSASQSKKKGKTTTTFNSFFSSGGWFRSIFISQAPEDLFTYDDPLTSATVDPPGPFKGTAQYTEGETSARGKLNGDLSVKFPGLERQPLANNFGASLYRSTGNVD